MPKRQVKKKKKKRSTNSIRKRKVAIHIFLLSFSRKTRYLPMLFPRTMFINISVNSVSLLFYIDKHLWEENGLWPETRIFRHSESALKRKFSTDSWTRAKMSPGQPVLSSQITAYFGDDLHKLPWKWILPADAGR